MGLGGPAWPEMVPRSGDPGELFEGEEEKWALNLGETSPEKGWRGQSLIHFPELKPPPDLAPAQSWPLGSGSATCWAVLDQRQVPSRKVVLCEKQHRTFFFFFF